MSNGKNYEKAATYQIRIKGNLDPKWADWFDGFTFDCQEGETVLTGPAADQSALHGLLAKINDLGLALLSVYEIPHPGSVVRTANKEELP